MGSAEVYRTRTIGRRESAGISAIMLSRNFIRTEIDENRFDVDRVDISRALKLKLPGASSTIRTQR